MSIFIDKNTTLIVQGITGRDGSFHTKQMMEYGTKVVGGVTPGKGGQKFEGKVPIFNTVADAVQATGANTTRHLRAADVRRRRDHGSGRRRREVHRLHHRRRAGARHDARLSVREGEGRAAPRPELPGTHHAGQVEGRHHSGTHLHAGQHRRRQPFRNAHLRSRISAYSRRHRPVDLRRHRRRSDQRHELHRLPRGVRGGSGDEGRRDDGRDRRHRRAGSRGVREEAHEEAGRRLHRRTDRAAGPPHGPRGRDHLRLVGHGRRKDRRRSRRPAWASPSVRWTSSSCSRRACSRAERRDGAATRRSIADVACDSPLARRSPSTAHVAMLDVSRHLQRRRSRTALRRASKILRGSSRTATSSPSIRRSRSRCSRCRDRRRVDSLVLRRHQVEVVASISS